ncbi:hypothetical protein WICPIJ_006890 [Wickerhamomyces pijperi]|nr:hypothetical protein WICPIJ_006890 [Wickerhamomyces pijperi]
MVRALLGTSIANDRANARFPSLVGDSRSLVKKEPVSDSAETCNLLSNVSGSAFSDRGKRSRMLITHHK